MSEVTCVVNAHREGQLIHPTLKSVMAACERAEACGVRTHILVILDRPDDDTVETVERLMDGAARIETVDFGDLSMSRNHAVTLIETEFTAFIDGDDLWGSSWLVESCAAMRQDEADAVLHPEYNVYFGGFEHVLRHVDSESHRFVIEHQLRRNYWTALSFSRTELYRRFPYTPNRIHDGFGYEDWTWNALTLRAGIRHKVVRDCSHFIRRGKPTPSLLDRTNSEFALPRVLEIYRQDPLTTTPSTLKLVASR